MLNNHTRCNKVVEYLLKICEDCLRRLEIISGAVGLERELSETLKELGIESPLLCQISGVDIGNSAEQAHRNDDRCEGLAKQQSRPTVELPSFITQSHAPAAANNRQILSQFSQPPQNAISDPNQPWGMNPQIKQGQLEFINCSLGSSPFGAMKGYSAPPSQPPIARQSTGSMPFVPLNQGFARPKHFGELSKPPSSQFDIGELWTEEDIEGFL
ncbi:uncharacterized protein N7498_007875 [Penicillium cinerascens]|uniref:Uncharacterized protein n=1 Tax=Penicillium cinerascens TaxID=70096 RepID=A0A9W9ME88_9EURO|nr:uncharacterized protein N7498_007875 [Penicillium cinerascens]KAJ5198758.1 hypothetical protein N7498_007875 [Penicillium cinerascens]